MATTMSRAQLYKIRRLIKKDGRDCYEYLQSFKGPIESYSQSHWVTAQMDAMPFVHQSEAVRTCERLKVKNDHPDVIYHTVVPA